MKFLCLKDTGNINCNGVRKMDFKSTFIFSKHMTVTCNPPTLLEILLLTTLKWLVFFSVIDIHG